MGGSVREARIARRMESVSNKGCRAFRYLGILVFLNGSAASMF